MGYARSRFLHFETYLRTVIGLDDEDIQLFQNKYNSNFVTYERFPGIDTIKDTSEAVYKMGDHEGTLQIEYDDMSMKTKLILTRFGGTFGNLRFDEKTILNTFLGVTSYWDFRPTNAIYADSPGVYTSDEISNLSTTNKTHLKFDVVDGSVVKGIRGPILFSCVLDKPPGYKVFCEPETIQYKKLNNSVLTTMTFYSENNNHEEVNLKGEMLTFNLQLIKI